MKGSADGSKAAPFRAPSSVALPVLAEGSQVALLQVPTGAGEQQSSSAWARLMRLTAHAATASSPTWR